MGIRTFAGAQGSIWTKLQRKKCLVELKKNKQKNTDVFLPLKGHKDPFSAVKEVCVTLHSTPISTLSRQFLAL